MKSKWKELLLDYIGVTCGVAVQSKPGEPVLAAIKSLGSGRSNTVFCRGCSFMPPFAALFDSTFDRSFSFDDTHLAGVLRPGVRVIPAAVDEAENTKCFKGSVP
jgi:2-methylcitrate dehydratase PrpD